MNQTDFENCLTCLEVNKIKWCVKAQFNYIVMFLHYWKCSLVWLVKSQIVKATGTLNWRNKLWKKVILESWWNIFQSYFLIMKESSKSLVNINILKIYEIFFNYEYDKNILYYDSKFRKFTVVCERIRTVAHVLYALCETFWNFINIVSRNDYFDHIAKMWKRPI